MEPIASASLGPAGTSLGASRIGVYFQHHLAPLAGAERAALLVEGTTETLGAPYEELERFARGADLLVNVSGTLADERLLEHVPVRLFLDLDPGFNQVWYEDGERVRLRRAHPLRHRRPGHRLRRLPGAHLRAGLDRHVAAGCPGALARGRPAVARCVHQRGPLAKLRLDRPRRGPLRAAGPLAAGADRAARPHRGGSSWPSRSTPTRPATWRPWRRTAGELLDPGQAAGTPDPLPRLRAGLQGRAGRGQERLRGLALRLVQRPERLLPGVGPAGGRPGDRLQRVPAGGRGPPALRLRRGGGERDRRGARATGSGTAERHASWPGSTWTPTAC